MPAKSYVFRIIRHYKVNGFLKTIKLILDFAAWKDRMRVTKIKGIQRWRLHRHYSRSARRLIIFFTPGQNIACGGILSINSIYNETCKLKNIHGAEAVMCTMPGETLLLEYTKFENKNFLYSFSGVLSYFRNCAELLIHIPELYVDNFVENYSTDDRWQRDKIKYLYVNIMLQNIDMAPSRKSIEELRKMAEVTCTTAHEAYSSLETQERLGCPVHKLSIFVSPEQYLLRDYSQKDNLMIISFDDHELKSTVLAVIAKQFPRLRMQVIENLSYEEYKRVISRAKWAITFGEGLDGYFVESIFSGGISFAVYNDKFFTEDFKALRTVYPDYDTLIKRICTDIAELDNESSYTQYQRKQYNNCAKYYNYKDYVNNIAYFYNKYYSSVSEV